MYSTHMINDWHHMFGIRGPIGNAYRTFNCAHVFPEHDDCEQTLEQQRGNKSPVYNACTLELYMANCLDQLLLSKFGWII